MLSLVHTPLFMLVVFLGRSAQFLLMLVALRISTWLLVPEEMGKMALLLSSVAFVSLFLISPVGMYVNRQLHTWNTHGMVAKYLRFHWLYIGAVAIVSTMVLGLINAHDVVTTHINTCFLVVFLFCTLFFNTINQTTIPSLNMLGFRVWFMILSILTILFGIIFSVILVNHYSHSAEYWLLGLLGGQILLAILGSLVFYSKINSQSHSMTIKPTYDNIKVVFKFSWPIAIAAGLTWFQSQSYRFFIEYSFGLQTLGLFVAGYGISAGIMAAFESVFTTYFQPFFYEKLSNENEEYAKVAWDTYAFAMMPTAVLLFFVITTLAPELTRFMLAYQYQDAAQYVVWGAAIELFRIIINVYSLAAHAKKDTRLLIAPNLIGAIVSVSLIYLLTPYLGIAGIGLALIIAGLCVTIFLHIQIRSQLLISVPYLSIGRAVFFGLIIFGINYYLELYVFNNNSLLTILIQMGIIGIILLPVEFLLLRRALF